MWILEKIRRKRVKFDRWKESHVFHCQIRSFPSNMEYLIGTICMFIFAFYDHYKWSKRLWYTDKLTKRYGKLPNKKFSIKYGIFDKDYMFENCINAIFRLFSGKVIWLRFYLKTTTATVLMQYKVVWAYLVCWPMYWILYPNECRYLFIFYLNENDIDHEPVLKG